MNCDIKRITVDEMGYQHVELMRNITITYEQTGPKFVDNSAADVRIG